MVLLLFVTFETFKRSFDIEILDIGIENLEINLKVGPSKIKFANSWQKVPKIEKQKKVTLNFNPTPRGHNLKHNTKNLNPYLGHVFWSFLKLVIWPCVWWGHYFGRFLAFWLWRDIFNLKSLPLKLKFSKIGLKVDLSKK